MRFASRAISQSLFLLVFFPVILVLMQAVQAASCGDENTNIALNKPVTASSATYYAEINEINNGIRSPGGYTVLVGDNPSLTIDLGDQCEISKINIEMLFQDGRQRIYHNVQVKLSEDQINWVTVFDSNKDGEFITSQAGKNITFSPTTARYVMVSSNGSTILNDGDRPSDNNWVEVEVYGVPLVAPTPTPVPVERHTLFLNGKAVTQATTQFADGSVTASPAPDSNGQFVAGTIVTMTVQPNSGIIAGWNGDCSGPAGSTRYEPSCSIMVGTNDRYAVVSFEQIITATLTPTPTIITPTPALQPTPTPTPITISAPTSCGSITIGGQSFERIPIKFYATSVNGREEVMFAPGTNTPFDYWEISQDEFISIAKQRYVDYVGGTTQYQQILQQDPSVLQPTPCNKYVWKDSVPWTIDSVKSALLLASDPNMCIIGGTVDAPLYVPCVSPAHDAYLQTLLTNPSQETLASVAQQLVAIQQSVEGIIAKIKQLNLSSIQINEGSVATGSNPSEQVSIADKNNNTLFSLNLNASDTNLTYGSISSVVEYANPADGDADTARAVYLIALSFLNNEIDKSSNDLFVIPVVNGVNALRATPEVIKMIYYSIVNGVSDQKANDAMKKANTYMSQPILLVTSNGKAEYLSSFSKMNNSQLIGEAMTYGAYIIPIGKFVPEGFTGGIISSSLSSVGQDLADGDKSRIEFIGDVLKGNIKDWIVQNALENSLKILMTTIGQ